MDATIFKIISAHPEWIAVNVGSDGTNPWIDALVFVSPEDVDETASLCHAALNEFFEDLGDAGLCYGDCIEVRLRGADIPFEVAYCDYDTDTDEISSDWELSKDELYNAGLIAYEVNVAGRRPV